jgi:hypothetical protein
MEEARGRGKKGKNLAENAGDAGLEVVSVESPTEQGNDSSAPAGEVRVHGELSIALPAVAGETWQHYSDALDEFASELAKSDVLEERALRIVQAMVPATGLPDFYKGIMSGFEVDRGKRFAVKLSNGIWLEA